MIKIWQSYSCNNSSSYRLVARFVDAAAAKLAAGELDAFFAAHAAEIDERDGYRREPSEVQRALAARYGFTWDKVLTWGDEGLVGDEPELVLHDRQLIVFHSYCGGFGDGIPSLLRALGGEVGTQDRGDLAISVLAVAPRGAHPELDAELATVVEAVDDYEDDDDPEPPWLEPVPVPWPSERESYGHVAVFRDAGTVGLHVAIDPRELPAVEPYLRARGVARLSIQIDEPGQGRVFRAIRKARCRSCEGELEYLDPRLHDIETPQLVCRPCGGFYELAAFVPQQEAP